MEYLTVKQTNPHCNGPLETFKGELRPNTGFVLLDPFFVRCKPANHRGAFSDRSRTCDLHSRVSVAGTVTVLIQKFRVGKKHRGLYLRLVLDTGRGWLMAYRNGRVLKRWPYTLLND
jgi:hypothetical protein